MPALSVGLSKPHRSRDLVTGFPLFQKATMKLNTLPFVIVLTISEVVSVPIAAAAQVQDMHAARTENGRERDALRTRVKTVQARVAEGRRSDKVTRTQAGRLNRQLSQLKASMTKLNRKQGFVSAAELASYNRALGEMDVALDGYGVPRGYGKDGLMTTNGTR